MNYIFVSFFKQFRTLSGFLLVLVLILPGCSRKSVNNTLNNTSTGNYVTDKAQRLKIERRKGYSKVTIINPWQGADNVNLIYNLVRRDTVFPSELNSSDVIFVPVRSIVCMSTTHLAMISALGEDISVSGVSGPGFVFSESLTKRIDAGMISDVGYDSGLNKELILSISPDLVMMYGIGSESAGYVGKIKELGIKVIFNADYLETDPLGKAEWIKLFGALYCKEEIADSIYRSELKSYDSLRLFISENISLRPKVLLGLPYKDTWYVSPGNSFISKIISDAGGDYLWKDTESDVSMPYGIENVYLGALKADYWLNIGSIKSGSEIYAVDERLTKLPCYLTGNLFNNNRRITSKGGNDYWESGTVFPHLILEDIAAIIHPEIFREHELFFYQKISNN
ncbi:MAG: ABC transporter substrate-binding protein [Bacteroidales bacterium]|nr:ABC transporter substrate-binding protein [Bacteroidales bacterium]